MKRTRSMLLLVWASVMLVGAVGAPGCGATLMDTPIVVADGHIDPFESVAPEWRGTVAPVFVASTREPSGYRDPMRFYTSERSVEVRLGRAVVEIGPGMAWDELVEASCAKRRGGSVAIRVTGYEEYGPLWSTAWPEDYRFARGWDAPDIDREPAERFVEAVDELLERSRRRQILIFVHGFNTEFRSNLELTSEFWHYMARDGVVINFEWPSRGSIFSYQDDKANAEFAVRQLRELLEFLGRHTIADEINIMAHSAGNPVVVEALRELSLKHYEVDDAVLRDRLKIGRVVLAAPDMDLDKVLSAGVDGAARMTKGVVVYASRRDRALGISADIFGNVRVGRSIGKLTEQEVAAIIAHDAQWIDVTRAQRRHPTFLGHSYFHQNPWVSSDLMIFLARGPAAEERGLVRNMETGFLEFPEDYEARLPEVVEAMLATHRPGSAR